MTEAVTYLGWSGFLVNAGDARVAIDPHWSSWKEPGALPPWDLTPLDGIVLTHGHGDHSGDIPALLTLHPKAWLAVGPGLESWAADLDLGGRLRVLPPLEEVVLQEGVSVRMLPGIHVGEGAVQAVRLVQYGLRRPLDALHLAREAMNGAGGGVYAVALRMPDGTSVLHAAETLHRGTDASVWEAQVADLEPDVLLLGVEPGEERAAGRLGAAVGAGHTIMFSPHASQREHFRLDARVRWTDVDRGLGAVRARATTDPSP